MNNYIIPMCEATFVPKCWVETINANSISDCQDKLMDLYRDVYDITSQDYRDFVEEAEESNIIIGSIMDYETL